MKLLDGKVTVITGASQGLGESMGRLFASQGAIVILAARSISAIQRISSELNESHYITTSFDCDVRKVDQVEALAKFTLDNYGRIDVWINNAGISGPFGRTLDLSEERFMDVIETNILGVYYGSKTALRQFLNQHHGKLINILGRGDDQPVPMQNAYASSKTWIRSFTLALAKEYKNSNIGIFAFNPGLMDTKFLRDIETFEGMEDQLKVMPFLIRGFAVSPEKAAAKVLWLVSNATNGKTGMYIRNSTRSGMILGVLRGLFKRSKVPIQINIKTIPSARTPIVEEIYINEKGNVGS